MLWMDCHQSIPGHVLYLELAINCHALYCASSINHPSYLGLFVTNQSSTMPCLMCHLLSITCYAFFILSPIVNHISCLVWCITNQSPVMPCIMCYKSITYHALWDLSPIVLHLTCLVWFASIINNLSWREWHISLLWWLWERLKPRWRWPQLWFCSYELRECP